MSGATTASAIGTPLPSRCAPPVPAQASPSLWPVPRLLQTLVRGLGNVLLLVVVLAFAGLAVGPHVLGYRTMTMLTGSMAPVINPGDVTVAVQEPTADLAVGQIISYQIPVDDHRVVSHRVVKVTHGAGGTVTVQTKGDHNAAADPWTAVVSDSRVWTVRAVVPHLGDVIRALRGPWLHIAFLYVGPALLTLLLLAEIWRSPRARADEGSPASVASMDGAVLDAAVLGELAADLGDAARLRSFLDLWSGMLSGRVRALREALETGDLETALDRILSLRSFSAMIGLTTLAATSSALEQHIQAGDLPAARAAFRAVDSQVGPARLAVATACTRLG
jgi:signal peptidase